jgi:hypothetical protein
MSISSKKIIFKGIHKIFNLSGLIKIKFTQKNGNLVDILMHDFLNGLGDLLRSG